MGGGGFQPPNPFQLPPLAGAELTFTSAFPPPSPPPPLGVRPLPHPPNVSHSLLPPAPSFSFSAPHLYQNSQQGLRTPAQALSSCVRRLRPREGRAVVLFLLHDGAQLALHLSVQQRLALCQAPVLTAGGRAVGKTGSHLHGGHCLLGWPRSSFQLFHSFIWKPPEHTFWPTQYSARRRPLIPEFGPSVLHVGPQLWFDLSASPLGQAHWDGRTMSCSTPPPRRSQASLVNSHDGHLHSTDYVSGPKG